MLKDPEPPWSCSVGPTSLCLQVSFFWKVPWLTSLFFSFSLFVQTEHARMNLRLAFGSSFALQLARHSPWAGLHPIANESHLFCARCPSLTVRVALQPLFGGVEASQWPPYTDSP